MSKVIVLNEGEEIFNIKGMSCDEKHLLIRLIQQVYMDSTEEEVFENKTVKIPFRESEERTRAVLSSVDFLMDVELEVVSTDQKKRRRVRLVSEMGIEPKKRGKEKEGVIEVDLFSKASKDAEKRRGKKNKVRYLRIEWSKEGLLSLLWRACLIENFDEYLKISDKYSQRMYLMILGEDGEKYIRYGKEQFWSNLDIPLSYLRNTGKIKQTVLKEALLELRDVFGMIDIEPERNYSEKGRPICGYAIGIGAI